MCGIAEFTPLHWQSAHVAPRIALGHWRLSDLAPLFRTFEMKLGNAFA